MKSKAVMRIFLGFFFKAVKGAWDRLVETVSAIQALSKRFVWQEPAAH